MSKILIIEDDEGLRESTADFLREEGFELTTAVNGLDGIHKTLKESPDLIICDISMNEMDGYDVFKTLQGNERTALIPFIFLTARSEREDIRTGMQLGADDYITKPFDFDELLNSIRIRLEKRMKQKKVSSDLFSSLLDNSLVGMFYLTNTTLEFVNPRLATLLGYTVDELQKREIAGIIHPDSQKMFTEKLLKADIFRKFHVALSLVDKNNAPIKADVYCVLAETVPAVKVIGIVRETTAGIEVPNVLADETLPDLVNFIIDHKQNLSANQTGAILSALLTGKKISTTEIPELSLTRRELEVLQFICQGFTNNEIAEKLFISQRTVDSHRANLLEKTGSSNTAELIVFAVRNSIINV
jgi:DNA-binding NarL/FixJ family response regulator